MEVENGLGGLIALLWESNCLMGLLVFLIPVMPFLLALRSGKDEDEIPERVVDARSIDPAESDHIIRQVADEVHGRWYEGRHADEVIHLRLPSREEIARFKDSDLKRSLRWLEREAGEVDVVLHYPGEPPIDRRVQRGRPRPGTVARRAEGRRRAAVSLPLLMIAVAIGLAVGGVLR